jgi:hypothetical protein
MRRLEGLGKGILLLHDIHPATVAALPGLLKALKDNRFRIVQVVPAAPYLIAMANKPKARSLASTLPGEAMIGDDGDRGAQPRWPHVVANVVADSVLPVPDASAFNGQHKKNGATQRTTNAAEAQLIRERRAP